MAVPVSLHAIVDEIEMLGGEVGMHAFLNHKTGELYGGTQDQLATADQPGDDEDLLAWEVEIIDRLREVLSSPDWLELPQRDAQTDYEIMERFCQDSCEGSLQKELLSAIGGHRPFNRFKDVLHHHGVQEKWYAFRREQIATKAKAWLEANEIAYYV